MDAVGELLNKFSDLNVNDTESKDEKPSTTDTSIQSNYQSAPWMKQYKFADIILPIHDAIFPNEIFDFDKQKHQQIFNAIDTNNDGFISQKEWLKITSQSSQKITSQSSEQSVIPIQRVYEVYRDINIDQNQKGISFDLWMKAILNIKLENIHNNKPKQVDDGNKNDSNQPSKEEHLLSDHIMTIRKCIDNVWKDLGPAHRENAYQKALMFELLDNGYKVLMEKRVPVYYYTKHSKKIHLVSMERIDLFIKYPATVIEMKAVSSKLSFKDEFQTKKYSKNRKCLSFLVNCPNNRDEQEIKCWTVGNDDNFIQHDVEQYNNQL